ncbi:MAG: hypothetical protein EPO08_02305 [Rhodospirillaceae bacterium]|nr:MAG: hypothetical protein EPO08_02305 [Rhodospirillaceae bacterium]
MLWPLLIVGVGSVLYWHFTDDVRPYAIVQFLPAILVSLMCWLFPAHVGPRETHVGTLLVGYGIAKILEAADSLVWRSLSFTVSGHSLKHIAAAASCIAILAFIQKPYHEP